MVKQSLVCSPELSSAKSKEDVIKYANDRASGANGNSTTISASTLALIVGVLVRGQEKAETTARATTTRHNKLPSATPAARRSGHAQRNQQRPQAVRAMIVLVLLAHNARNESASCSCGRRLVLLQQTAATAARQPPARIGHLESCAAHVIQIRSLSWPLAWPSPWASLGPQRLPALGRTRRRRHHLIFATDGYGSTCAEARHQRATLPLSRMIDDCVPANRHSRARQCSRWRPPD